MKQLKSNVKFGGVPFLLAPEDVRVSSRVVAEKFGKRHDNVIRDIRNLISSLKIEGSKETVDFYKETKYITERGKEHSEFMMNRGGYMLVVMGFTGTEALKLKVFFIRAFDALLEDWKKQHKRMLARTDRLYGELVAEAEHSPNNPLNKPRKLVKTVRSENDLVKQLEGLCL